MNRQTKILFILMFVPWMYAYGAKHNPDFAIKCVDTAIKAAVLERNDPFNLLCANAKKDFEAPVRCVKKVRKLFPNRHKLNVHFLCSGVADDEQIEKRIKCFKDLREKYPNSMNHEQTCAGIRFYFYY